MKKEKKFKTNIFYFYASDYKDRAVDETEIRSIDMTDEFWREVNKEIENDELVNININAKVRSGKSTLGISLGREIFELLILHKKRKDGEFSIDNIARDQQEYSKLMRDSSTSNTIIVTDEINELEDTGENVTIERTLNNVFSNVQAGRYVHRISCSPKGVADPNADILLEVVSVDRKNYVTHCHLYYRMFSGGEESINLLGFVNFSVKDLIYNWETKVKRVFYKKRKTKEDKEFIKKWRKRDFYVEYIIMKYEKMELITNEGIMRPRTLDYAYIILEVEEKLRGLARYPNLINKGIIKNYVKMYCRKAKIPTSIVGEELMTQEVEGIINLWKGYFKINNQILALKAKPMKDPIIKESKIKQLQSMLDDINGAINIQIDELSRYKEINEKYHRKISKK